jgi:very-short-patch-repair endonuclease
MTSPLEATLLQLILDDGLPRPLTEYRFAEEIGRMWRADFAWPDERVLAEAEGGVWTQGRHVRGQGFIDDCEKYNWAALLGWVVLRFPPCMIADGTAVKMIRKALDCAA